MSGGVVKPVYQKEAQCVIGSHDFGTVISPISAAPAEPTLFGTTSALLRYFVRPYDDFVLNSLEIVDADVYLYRLLRKEGYERIAFIDTEDRKCNVFVYDLESSSLFETEMPSGQKETDRGTPLRRQYGKRIVASFVNSGSFTEYFCTNICRALTDRRYKTVVVAPLHLFKKSGYCRNTVIDAVEMAEKSRHGKNILLFALPQRNNILQCFEEPYSRLHSSWTSAITAAGRKPDELVSYAIDELLNRGMIVLADNYDTDEIANLLLRKKFIEQEAFLQDIGTSQIYSLALRLKEHCLKEKKRFPASIIPFIDRRHSCIRDINTLLDSQALQQALVKMGAEAEPAKVPYSKAIPSLMIRRVYHDEKSDSEHTNIATQNEYSGPGKELSPEKRGLRAAPVIVYKKELAKAKMEKLPSPYMYSREVFLKERSQWLEENIKPAILCVEAGEERGTGFFIHPQGYFLTCDHVIRHARKKSSKISVKISQVQMKSESVISDTWIECEVKFAHELSDIALLKLRGSGEKLPYLPLESASREITPLEDFILPGYPLSGKTNDAFQVYTGHISSGPEDSDHLGYSRFYIEGEAKSGNSGSPLISLKTGRVIGLLQGSHDEISGTGKVEEMNFIRPIKYFWTEIVKEERIQLTHFSDRG